MCCVDARNVCHDTHFVDGGIGNVRGGNEALDPQAGVGHRKSPFDVLDWLVGELVNICTSTRQMSRGVRQEKVEEMEGRMRR